jgi:hypothetical protein
MGAYSNYSNVFYKDYEELFQKNEKLAGELRTSRYNYSLAMKHIEALENREQEALRQNAALSARAEELAREVERLKAILNIDGSNSGLPTSKTPLK